MGDLALKSLYTIPSKAAVIHGLQARPSAEIKSVRFRMKESSSLTMETTTFEPHILIQKSKILKNQILINFEFL